jgi:hypothetical protein
MNFISYILKCSLLFGTVITATCQSAIASSADVALPIQDGPDGPVLPPSHPAYARLTKSLNGFC